MYVLCMYEYMYGWYVCVIVYVCQICFSSMLPIPCSYV